MVGNRNYGFEVDSKRLEDHEQRAARGDFYSPRVGVSMHGNTVTGNEGGCVKGSQVQQLRLSDFRTDLDSPEIKAVISRAGVHLDISDDQAFGSELKPFATKLRKVFESEKPVVEFKNG